MAVEPVPGVEGLGELLRTLKSLPGEIVSRSGGPVKSGLRKAGQVFQREAQANIDRIVAEPNEGNRTSESTGTLRGAVIVSRDPRPAQSGANERYVVRLRRSAKAPNGANANVYGGVLEFGREGGEAKPWLRPVVPAKSSEAVQVFIVEARKGIDRAVKRARKQGLL